MSKSMTEAQQNMVDALRKHEGSQLIINHEKRAAVIMYPVRIGFWQMYVPYPTAVKIAKNPDLVYCNSQGNYELLSEPQIDMETI